MNCQSPIAKQESEISLERRRKNLSGKREGRKKDGFKNGRRQQAVLILLS
jgi:hypothetical protein